MSLTPPSECSIDTGTPNFGPCSGPGASHTPASPLANNTYIYRVMATDADRQHRPEPGDPELHGQLPSLPPDGRIAFASNRDGELRDLLDERRRHRPDPAHQQRRRSTTDPAWSPDGTKIAFTTDRDGNFEIYVMNADGTGQTRLTNNAAADDEPAWSPDGSKIAFTSRPRRQLRDLRR